MPKLIFLWFIVVISSPFIVFVGGDQFQETGWLAIGKYNFDILDGLYRSLYYFIITTPVIIALYLGRPKFNENKKIKFNIGLDVKRWHIFLMIIFCMIAFYFNLGITGVETVTGLGLSGMAHYIRSYLFIFIIAIYVFNNNKPSLLLVALYSMVAGITGGSRFAAVAPLVLLLFRNLNDSEGRILGFRGVLILILIITLFLVITQFRIVLYDENYTRESIFTLISFIDFGESEYVFQGVSQLFLRLGIGRDVILSYEVAADGVCNNLWGLFFQSGSCIDPPLDFYGFSLSDNRFYIAPPALSSLFVISDNFLMKLIISVGYAILVYLMCLLTKRLHEVPMGNLFAQAAFFLIVIFVTIGPISFAWVLTGLLIVANLLFFLIRMSCRKY